MQKIKRALSLGLSSAVLAFAMVSNSANAQSLGRSDSGSFDEIMTQLESSGQRVVAKALSGLGTAKSKRWLFTVNEAGTVGYILSGERVPNRDDPRELKVEARLEGLKLFHADDISGQLEAGLAESFRQGAEAACDEAVAQGHLTQAARESSCGFLNRMLVTDFFEKKTFPFMQGIVTVKDGNGGHRRLNMMITVGGNFRGYRPERGSPLHHPAMIYTTSMAQGKVGMTIQERGGIMEVLQSTYIGQFIFTVPRQQQQSQNLSR